MNSVTKWSGNASPTWQATGVWLLLSFVLLLAGCGRVISDETPVLGATGTTDTLAADLLLTSTATLTATPAPYTPEPTPTPTITPTPIIYRVQAGDNLISIGQRFGISAEAIREANGIEDPSRLQVNQALIIPMDEEALASLEPTPTATPLPVEISNLTFARTPTEGMWVLGEVINTSATNLEQVQVAVALLDAEHAVLTSAAAFVETDLVPPDAHAPFAILFSSAPASFDSYQVSLLSAVSAHVGSYYRDLTVENTQGEGERNTAYRVTGEVYNVGPEEALDVTIVVTTYDALGRVVGVRRDVPEHNVIPVGGHTTFEVAVAPAAGPVASYSVQAQGRRIVPTPSF